MLFDFHSALRHIRSVVPCARELGIGIVAYSPLCRGLLTGAVDATALPSSDRRSSNPRFTADNFSTNMAACAQPLAKIAGTMFSRRLLFDSA